MEDDEEEEHDDDHEEMDFVDEENKFVGRGRWMSKYR